MGFSKIFNKKEPENQQIKYEEQKEREEEEIFGNRERSSSLLMNESHSDDLKLIEDDEELAKFAQNDVVATEIAKDTQLSEKERLLKEGNIPKNEYVGEVDAPLIPREQILAAAAESDVQNPPIE